MTSEIKLRMSAFKDSEIKTYDDNISKYSSKAVDVPFLTPRTFSKAKRYWPAFASFGAAQRWRKNVRNLIGSLP
jgi:hypothetical protein